MLAAAQATRAWVGVNTNLGALLLLAPLCAVPQEQPLNAQNIQNTLAAMTAEDAAAVYQAIRCANPGGLGKAEEMDVAEAPPEDLLLAMRAAAKRDLVARQYAENFAQVLQAADWLTQFRQSDTLTEAIVLTQLHLMSRFPDTLIARKCGWETARQSAEMAQRVLRSGRPGDAAYWRAVEDLDFWLRCDGHRRNPGAVADLIAAALFVVIREGRVEPPFR